MPQQQEQPFTAQAAMSQQASRGQQQGLGGNDPQQERLGQLVNMIESQRITPEQLQQVQQEEPQLVAAAMQVVQQRSSQGAPQQQQAAQAQPQGLGGSVARV